MAVRVAINGLGRIGRCFLRAVYSEQSRGAGDSTLDIVAINDIGNIENLAYLLAHDSVYHAAPFSVEVQNGKLVLNGKEITCMSEREPSKLPWKDLHIDIVVESTGMFDRFDMAGAHITAGAKRVVISAPVKDEGGATVLMGVNEEKLKTTTISSNASCTTNSASPVIAILDEKLGIEKAVLNTIHSYTATQSIVDSPVRGEDFRRGRAAAQNMSPSSTGAATAVTKAYEKLAGRFDGIAVRVPVICGSLADITFIAKRDTSAEEVNQILKAAAAEARGQGIFAVTEEPLVSSDIIGRPEGSIADLGLTRVVGGNLVKVMAWYDNEMGYAHTLLRHVKEAGKYLPTGRQVS
ncbi:MAG: glyceraldehyde 3-phosphate dehydrogenase NAD-binding domain-containing protein [bacterium]|nr:glyceraldehyde 3-phosphate dehydrogenase NAD-binding domain-containing protein [bacterium]